MGGNEVQELLEFLEETQPTGLVVVGDDRLALRVLQYLQLDKYKVPDDISLISFNNSVFATLSHPFLTTIDIHVQELARQAAALLIRQLNEPSALLPKMIVPHEVIERETVMRVRGEYNLYDCHTRAFIQSDKSPFFVQGSSRFALFVN